MTESTDDDLLAQAVARAAAAARWSPAEVARVKTWARRMPMANRSDFLDVAAEVWCQKHLDKYEDYTMKFDRSPLAFREEFASVFMGVLREGRERLERLSEAGVADQEDLTLLEELRSNEERVSSSGDLRGAPTAEVKTTSTDDGAQAAAPIEVSVPQVILEEAAGTSPTTALESTGSPGNSGPAGPVGQENDVFETLVAELSSCDADLLDEDVLRFLRLSADRTLRRYRAKKGFPEPDKGTGRNVNSLLKIVEWCRQSSVKYYPQDLPERVKQKLAEAQDRVADRDRTERWDEMGKRHADQQYRKKR